MQLDSEIKNYFDQKFTEVEKHFDGKFIEVERRFDNKFVEVDKRSDAKFVTGFSEMTKHFDIKFNESLSEIKRHNDTLLEAFRHDLKAMTEQLPTRTDVRDIVREELDDRLQPIETDIHVIKLEIKDHGRRITRLEKHCFQ